MDPADTKKPIVVGHQQVPGPMEPCTGCGKDTAYQAIMKPLAMLEGDLLMGFLAKSLEFRRRVCLECIEDLKGTARTLARGVASLRTHTRTPTAKEPDDE